MAIAGALDGSAQIVVVGDDDLLYHAMRFPGHVEQRDVAGFARLDGYAGASVFAARDVTIAITGSNFHITRSAHVVANSLAGGGLYRRVRWTDGDWTGFGSVPGSHGLDTQELAIGMADSGDAYITATYRNGGDSTRILAGSLEQRRLGRVVPVAASGHVKMWRSLSPGGSSPIARMAFTDAGGNTWYQERGSINLSSSWSSAANNANLLHTGSRRIAVRRSHFRRRRRAR